MHKRNMDMMINTGHTDMVSVKDSTILSVSEDKKDFFSDNLEHLQAVEHEAKIMLALAYLVNGKRKSESLSTYTRRGMTQFHDRSGDDVPDLGFLKLPLKNMTPDDVARLLSKVQSENRAMERESTAHEIELNFLKVCESYALCEKECMILMLIFANNTGTSFRNMYEKCGIDRNSDGKGRMSIEALLAIISSGYREQIENRKYFSIDSPLIKEEILMTWGTDYDATNNILAENIYLHERIVRYILGDNNTYDTSLQCIVREKGNVSMLQVVLPDDIKENVLEIGQNYTTYSMKRKSLGIDDFYGYGTGLVYLFHGVSGTGKTMLAKALATKLDKTLLTLNIENISQMNSPYTSFEDIIKYVFKEARLTDGIVFFDECDDIFKDNSTESRALLVEIEKSNCITILATNKVLRLDPSLDRRITMKVSFHIPSELERRRIWKSLLPSKVRFDNDVDLEKLARKYIFTGGLIKNSIFMAVNIALSRDDDSDLTLSMEVLEKAADCQTSTFYESSGIDSSYTPNINIEQLPMRVSDKKELLNLAPIYKGLEAQGLGLSVLVGSTDIQTGLDVVEGVAKASDLKVRKFPLENIFEDRMSKIKDPVTQNEVHYLDFAFSSMWGYRSATIFVDHNSILEHYLEKSENEPSMTLFSFLEKLRAFKGMFFLVTRPMKNRHIPIEFNHYMEIKHPPEELQIRRWEDCLNGQGLDNEIVALIEQHPMYLREIDFIARQANIRSCLSGCDEKVSLDLIYRIIADYKRNNISVPVLFGDKIKTAER